MDRVDKDQQEKRRSDQHCKPTKYVTLHTTKPEYLFFSSAYGTLSKINYIFVIPFI